MRIVILNKKSRKKAGVIRSCRFSAGCNMDLTYQRNSDVIIEIQKVLAKYYDLKYVSGESGKKPSKLIIPEVVHNKQKTRIVDKYFKEEKKEVKTIK